MSNKLLIILSAALSLITIGIIVFYDGHLNEMRASMSKDDKLIQAIDSIKTSLAEYRTKYEFAQSEYGVDIEIRKTDSVWYISTNQHSAADSAKILLKHFRDRLELKDSTWVVRK